MLAAGFLSTDDLKARILPGSVADATDWDTQVAALGKGVAAAMNKHCNRILQRGEDVTDEFSAANLALVLRRYPVEAIDSIQLRDFTGSLTTHTAGYQNDLAAGLVRFASLPGDATERLVVTYTGGYWLDDGGSQPSGSEAMPDDILEAFVMQAQAWAEARGLFQSMSLTTADESRTRPSATGLLPEVRRILDSHRRFAAA